MKSHFNNVLCNPQIILVLHNNVIINLNNCYCFSTHVYQIIIEVTSKKPLNYHKQNLFDTDNLSLGIYILRNRFDPGLFNFVSGVGYRINTNDTYLLRGRYLRLAVDPESESVRPSSPLTARRERRMSSGSRRMHDERRRSLRRGTTLTSPAAAAAAASVATIIPIEHTILVDLFC